MHPSNENPLFQCQTPTTDPIIDQLKWVSKLGGPKFRNSDCRWYMRSPSVGERTGNIELCGVLFWWTSCGVYDFVDFSGFISDIDGVENRIIMKAHLPSKTITWSKWRPSSQDGDSAVFAYGRVVRFKSALSEAIEWDFEPRKINGVEWFRTGAKYWEANFRRSNTRFMLSISTFAEKRWGWESRCIVYSTDKKLANEISESGYCETLEESMTASAKIIDEIFHAAA